MTILFESAIRVTLIAAVIGLVLCAMRIKTASVLHAVWAGVVVVMLLLPAWLAWGPKAPLPVLPPQLGQTAIAMPTVDIPAGAPVEIASTSPEQHYAFNWVLGVYLLGLCILLLRLAIGTIRANRLTSATCAVPVTVGVLHPRVILPECSREWPQAQLDAVLAHEGEHVRRRDPLFQWLALLNRALFWFHPLAWWLERKLSGLAEEACDAAVLARGYDAREYSEYLLDLARSVQRAGKRINAVGMAMSGIGLKHRIRQMLSGVPVPRISRPRTACTVAMCAGAAAILAAGTLVRAQSKIRARPVFEVASVRSCKDVPGDRGGPVSFSPGRLTSNCQSVDGLIHAAYVIFANGQNANTGQSVPIEGGPAWMNSEHYTINATAEGNAKREMMSGPMMQALLEDRFRLKIHRETREIPIYVLTVAKGGLKLKPFKEGSCTPRPPRDLTKPGPPPALPPGEKYCASLGTSQGPNMVVDAQGMSIDEFSIFLRTGSGRPVVDKTGITGKFDFHLEYAPNEDLRRRLPDDPGEPTAPSIFTALQEQLGLKLEPAKGPGEFLVIDHIERPSEN